MPIREPPRAGSISHIPCPEPEGSGHATGIKDEHASQRGPKILKTPRPRGKDLGLPLKAHVSSGENDTRASGDPTSNPGTRESPESLPIRGPPGAGSIRHIPCRPQEGSGRVTGFPDELKLYGA